MLYKLLGGHPFNVCDLPNFRELENPRTDNYTCFIFMYVCLHVHMRVRIAIGVALLLNNYFNIYLENMFACLALCLKVLTHKFRAKQMTAH